MDMKRKRPATRPRGRPKVPWEPIAAELSRRLSNGEACPNVEAESRYLAEFVKLNRITASGEKTTEPIKSERIRERIKKRHDGSRGYQRARERGLAELRQKTESDPG